MDELNSVSDIDHLKDGPWDELFVLSGHWKSDLEFYRADLRFLHLLIAKYFMWITKEENLERVNELTHELANIKVRGADLAEKIGKHHIRLGYLMKDPNRGDAGTTIMEHEHLEEEMTRFVRLFRENRKRVFSLTEYIIDSEELADIVHS